jgi:hypothetical protein
MCLDMPADDRCTHRNVASGEQGPGPPAELRLPKAELAEGAAKRNVDRQA